jgi:hypothetical protein
MQVFIDKQALRLYFFTAKDARFTQWTQGLSFKNHSLRSLRLYFFYRNGRKGLRKGRKG